MKWVFGFIYGLFFNFLAQVHDLWADLIVDGKVFHIINLAGFKSIFTIEYALIRIILLYNIFLKFFELFFKELDGWRLIGLTMFSLVGYY